MSKPTKERSVVMQAQSVQAILTGAKTQFREPIKPALPECVNRVGFSPITGMWVGFDDCQQESICKLNCPYAVGMKVWVRETYTEAWFNKEDDWQTFYKADHGDWGSTIVDLKTGTTVPAHWIPSIHMPRVASRLTLEICEVRVQRVRDISEEDAKSEGASLHTWYCPSPDENTHISLTEEDFTVKRWPACYKNGFANLWDSLNKKRMFSFEANPFVWALTFRRVEEAKPI